MIGTASRQVRRAMEREAQKAIAMCVDMPKIGDGATFGMSRRARRALEHEKRVKGIHRSAREHIAALGAPAIAGPFLDAVEGVWGSGDAAMAKVPKAERAGVLLALHEQNAPVGVFRDALEEAWLMSHRAVRHMLGDDDLLRAMMRYAEFTPPAGVPETFPVWRGTVGLDVTGAAAGMSWALRRDVACKYSMGLQNRGFSGAPLVVRGRARRDAVLFWYDGLADSELVLSEPPADVVIDGTPAEWIAGDARERARLIELIPSLPCKALPDGSLLIGRELRRVLEVLRSVHDASGRASRHALGSFFR